MVLSEAEVTSLRREGGLRFMLLLGISFIYSVEKNYLFLLSACVFGQNSALLYGRCRESALRLAPKYEKCIYTVTPPSSLRTGQTYKEKLKV